MRRAEELVADNRRLQVLDSRGALCCSARLTLALYSPLLREKQPALAPPLVPDQGRHRIAFARIVGIENSNRRRAAAFHPNYWDFQRDLLPRTDPAPRATCRHLLELGQPFARRDAHGAPVGVLLDEVRQRVEADEGCRGRRATSTGRLSFVVNVVADVGREQLAADEIERRVVRARLMRRRVAVGFQIGIDLRPRSSAAGSNGCCCAWRSGRRTPAPTAETRTACRACRSSRSGSPPATRLCLSRAVKPLGEISVSERNKSGRSSAARAANSLLSESAITSACSPMRSSRSRIACL